MALSTARSYADKILAWLSPHCHRLEVAGSIRRELPFCGDVDIVCIPKVTEPRDLLGTALERTNHLLKFLQDYVRERNPSGTQVRPPYFQSGGEREGKSAILQLPKCQLDLWFADESTWATRLLCRTGSKEHNIWLADRATDRNMHWNPYEGLRPLTTQDYFPAGAERDIYSYLGLDYIDPKNRELPWLKKNIGSGL